MSLSVCPPGCSHTCTDCSLAIGLSDSAFTWLYYLCVCLCHLYKARNKLEHQQKSMMVWSMICLPFPLESSIKDGCVPKRRMWKREGQWQARKQAKAEQLWCTLSFFAFVLLTWQQINKQINAWRGRKESVWIEVFFSFFFFFLVLLSLSHSCSPLETKMTLCLGIYGWYCLAEGGSVVWRMWPLIHDVFVHFHAMATVGHYFGCFSIFFFRYQPIVYRVSVCMFMSVAVSHSVSRSVVQPCSHVAVVWSIIIIIIIVILIVHQP